MDSKSPSQPSVRPKASQKVVSRKYCACTSREGSSRCSVVYPPSLALVMTSWMRISVFHLHNAWCHIVHVTSHGSGPYSSRKRDIMDKLVLEMVTENL